MTATARQVATLSAMLVLLGACVPICGIGAKFALSNARVDSQFNCPNGSDHLPYQVHGSIDAANSLSNAVTIKSINESDELVSTAGDWNGSKPGTDAAKASGPITNYSPKSVASGANDTIKFSVGFVCTSSGPTVTTYGDFAFTFTVKTSAGTYTIKAGNHHRLNFPPP